MNSGEQEGMPEAAADIAGSQAVIRPQNHHSLRPTLSSGTISLVKLITLSAPMMLHLSSKDIEPAMDLTLAFAVHCVLGCDSGCEEGAGICLPHSF